jgi:hypothetical protein
VPLPEVLEDISVRRSATVIAAAVAISTLAACSTVDSADIRTNGITADIVVVVPEGASGATVRASLRVGALTFVELADGEKLTARAGETAATLERAKFAGATDYSTKLDGVTAAGTEVVVGLQRTANDTSAPRSSVRLPEPLALDAPRAGARFSRSRDDVVVRIVTEKDQPAVLTWAGECVTTGSLDVPAGSTTMRISRGTIRAASPATRAPTASPSRPPSNCQVRLTVTRHLRGTLDPAYGEGTISAETSSARDILSVP